MKRNLLIFIGTALCSFFPTLVPAFAQGTAFTYQGRLNSGTNPANGSYDLRFAVFNALTAGTQQGSLLTNSATAVSNGLFTVQLDFGAGIFNGNARWLEIGVRTNGTATFTTLIPRQPVMPVPYSIFAGTASNVSGMLPAAQLSGTVGNGQLANSAITVNAGSGLSGGGAVALGGSTTLNNAGITSVTGNTDITASTVNGAVTLNDTATSVNTGNTIVKRDASGNFSAGTASLTSATVANIAIYGVSPGIITSLPLTIQADQGLHLNPNAGNQNPANGSINGVFIGDNSSYPVNLNVIWNLTVGDPNNPNSAQGSASVRTLTIRGGADIAEPFHISTQEIAAGSIVIIDEDNPGQLKLSDRAYDKRVAGIVSGANGIHPGLSLSQQGVLEGGQNVALSGRVYALADASYGAVKPGDLLTTSGTPGHCMKVTDPARAQGAIIGKAMSSLKNGKGMVLVLVSLQ